MKLPFILSLLLFCSILSAQQPAATPPAERMRAFEQRKTLNEQSLLKEVAFRSVGPTVFSGRVTDIEVHPDDPTVFYVAYASGGLWKTENNGMSFHALFDQQAVMTIGDIAVDWKRSIIYVGTGENNSSRSSYSGVGMYKSIDEGKTWIHLGLADSHHIGRIMLHPEQPDWLTVAVLGHLYSPNRERGVYQSRDGGANWEQVFFVDENSGAVDLIADPQNADILYAAFWERTRRAWNFQESGEGSGIYKSSDGGKNWTLLTAPQSGFPHGEGVGRIGLGAAVEKGNTVVFAVLDNYFRRPKKDKEQEELLTKDELRNMTEAEFVKLQPKRLKYYLSKYNFPKKYTPDYVTELVKKKKLKPLALVEYVEDANSLLFDTPVIGAEVYRSDDGGRSWNRTHKEPIDNMFNSYGYYFGQIRVQHNNPQKLYILGVPILRSDDGGQSFKSINGDNVHVDHHALWLNPRKAGHLILGNDGGVNISYDDGEHWIKCNSLAVGQFYSVNVDMAEPYNIYGGLQDNGLWVGRSTYKANTRWHGTGNYPYSILLGGDGMQVAIDSRNNSTIYAGFQFGNYYRINKEKNEHKAIKPRHELGERPLRMNWQSPIHLSVHNEDILYFGANKVFRSLDQGNSFDAISDDLTKGGRKGDVPYGTLSSLHESPLRFGLLYAGSDDGLLHLSKDGGHSWQNISAGLPQDQWISRVQASRYQEGRVYVSLNGYRWDDFAAYLYVSEDFGANWQKVGSDLPTEPINVVKEDPVNENILYVGTDHGLYVSLDRGGHFMQMNKELPAVAVHDLIVHPRDRELVVATHGRSFYVADVSHLQQLTEEVLGQKLYVFDIQKVKHSEGWGKRWSQWSEFSELKVKIPFFANTSGNTSLALKLPDGTLLRQMKMAAGRGINYYEYDLSIDKQAARRLQSAINKELKAKDEAVKIREAKNGKYYLHKEKYIVEIIKDGKRVKKELMIE